MDPFELLKTDHRKVAKLFEQLEAASGKSKIGIFNQIKQELELHTHIEEKIFYPVLEKTKETHDITLEAYEEHDVVKTLLAELAANKTANDEWDAKAKVLRENVEHHVDEEEGEMFPKADNALSDEQLEDLGNRMEMEKARKQGRSVQKVAASSKAAARKGSEGVLSKIANFVGMGSDTASKKSAKGKTARRASSTSSKAKKASTKKSTASKRSSTSQAAKRSSTAKKSTKSRSAAKKSGKKKAARKK